MTRKHFWGKFLWNSDRNKAEESCRTVATVDSKVSSSEDDVDEQETTRTTMTDFSSSSSSSSQDDADDLDLTAIMRQAETALNVGNLRESLGHYDTVIELLRREQQEHETPPMIALANVCYTCTRIAKRLKDFHAAYQYTLLELSCVEEINSVLAASSHSELAEMCHYELGDSERALQHYKIALGLHCARWKNCDIRGCCRHTKLCAKHQREVADIKACIQDTKECIGRVQFGMGMVADALRML